MPYTWTLSPNTRPSTPATILTLWPHRSLPPKGFAAIMLMAFLLITLPLFGLLGTLLLWVMLPFMLIALAALWLALRRSYRDGYVTEILSRHGDELSLTHQTSDGEIKQWRCNCYWVHAKLHQHSGPVPQYITLSGNHRTVEIGAFLSEDERLLLFAELQAYLHKK